MLANLEKYKIILGSNSPRRQELMAGLDIDFEVRIITDIDESYPAVLKEEDVPAYIARKKAEAYKSSMADDELLITADTVVWTFEEILGKPKDRDGAISMLQKLSDHVHEVITGVCIISKDRQIDFSVFSAVSFSKLDDDEIVYYVDKYKPFDKAGSYGIQEWIGYVGVESINGSFYNVMGLPIQRLYQELKKWP